MLNQKADELKKREEKVKAEEKALKIEKDKAVMNGEKLKADAIRIGEADANEKSEVVPQGTGKSTGTVSTTVKQPAQPSSLQHPVRVPATSQARTGLMQRLSDKRVAEPASNRAGNKSQIPQSRSSRLRLLQSAR